MASADSGVAPAPSQARTSESGALTILINELSNGTARSTFDSFFELRNWGEDTIDLAGWNIYRCDGMGLRVGAGRPETDLSRVTLAPGEIFTVSKAGMPGDAHTTSPFAARGYGLYLEGPGGVLVDRVAVYPTVPWPTMSECSSGRNLSNTLNFAHDESWQRVAATGDPARDFRATASTAGAANREAVDTTTAREAPETSVVLSEFAPTGPAGNSDEFVELENRGDTTQDIGGWRMFRCTAGGRLTPETLQLTVPAGTALAPGERWVAAPRRGFGGEADARYDTPFANLTAGVLIETAAGELIDRVSVTTYGDSACQNGNEKLAAVLDQVAGESYQRAGDGFIVAPRTPGLSNATIGAGVFGQPFSYPQAPAVAISEFATDPPEADMPTGRSRQNFVEIANYGVTPVDIGGWSIRRCEQTGIRSRDVQVVIDKGTVLWPGGTFLAARTGTSTDSDRTFATAFNMLGTGVWIADADGARIDSVGVYAANEMDADNISDSPCTKGIALTTYQPDRMLGETFQRSTFTGVDADDFVTAPATPGEKDRVAFRDPTRRIVSRAAPATPSTHAAALPAPRAVVSTAATPLDIRESWIGATIGAPLTAREGADEKQTVPTTPLSDSIDDAWGLPYQRFAVSTRDIPPDGIIAWTGETYGRAEVQLSVWSDADGGWRTLDADSDADADAPIGSAPSTPDEPGVRTTSLQSSSSNAPDAGGAAVATANDPVRVTVRLEGALTSAELSTDSVSLLVQAGPRTERTARAAGFSDPADYDFAISHFTDTQYLSESYPEVYAQLTSWIADNADDRKIEFASHTGDLVQNWVDAAQNEVRARREFERASEIQSILDDAGVANSVLPGNHDNKRGVSNDLFNEYFGPDRYADRGWYGGSISPDDNSANFSTFERAGAKFLMLSLPYAYGEREISWAERVVADHPSHNAVVSTHEHLTPKTQWADARRSTTSRWLSRADQLWERVIAPNRSVVMVLSGHFHGLGKIVTENAGGLEGHTVVEMLADYQEFRTGTGERATGFQRLLQLDLAGGTVEVDTFSALLDAQYSHEYDYPQFRPENGRPGSLTNSRPWNIVDAGVTGRYSVGDDEFTERVSFQYPKLISTRSLGVTPG